MPEAPPARLRLLGPLPFLLLQDARSEKSQPRQSCHQAPELAQQPLSLQCAGSRSSGATVEPADFLPVEFVKLIALDGSPLACPSSKAPRLNSFEPAISTLVEPQCAAVSIISRHERRCFPASGCGTAGQTSVNHSLSSHNDLALKVSTWLAGTSSASALPISGLMKLLKQYGITVIDASDASQADVLGHSAFAENADILRAMRNNFSGQAGRRRGRLLPEGALNNVAVARPINN